MPQLVFYSILISFVCKIRNLTVYLRGGVKKITNKMSEKFLSDLKSGSGLELALISDRLPVSIGWLYEDQHGISSGRDIEEELDK